MLELQIMFDSECAVFAMFATQDEANAGLNALFAEGIDATRTMVLTPDHRAAEIPESEPDTEILVGVLTGAVVGGLVGMILGAVIDELPFVNQNSMSWIGLSIIVGGLGVVLGGASGALIGIGTPQPLPLRFAHHLREGGFVTVVHVDSRVESHRVIDTLIQNGGFDAAVGREIPTLDKITEQQHPPKHKWFEEQEV